MKQRSFHLRVAGLAFAVLVVCVSVVNCGASNVEASAPSLDPAEREPAPAGAGLASGDCSSTLPGASVGVRELDGGKRTVAVRLGPQEQTGGPCSGRKPAGTATSD